jgi:hypothetical protein
MLQSMKCTQSRDTAAHCVQLLCASAHVYAAVARLALHRAGRMLRLC